MAIIFANIPIVEIGAGNFEEVHVVCGLRIISGSVDRSNLKYGSEPVGQSYSMPWSYPDANLGDLGGPTTIVLTMMALLPDGRFTPLQLSRTLNASTSNGATALSEINTELQAMVANVALSVNTAGLLTPAVRVLSLEAEETFPGAPVVIELIGRDPDEVSTGFPNVWGLDVVLGRALALPDYSDDEPRPRTAHIATVPLPNGTNPWLRFSGLTKLSDLNTWPAIGTSGSLPGIPLEEFPVFLLSPWHVNTTRPIGDTTDGPISSHAGMSLFSDILTAADLNLDDADIPTGWILVYDLHYTFHDGFLEIEADLANTTPLAPEFKLGPFGKMRGEIRLNPARFDGEPFSAEVFASILAAVVELEWDDDPGSDVEDFHPVDPWFEEIVGGMIQNAIEENVNAQIVNEVAPRAIAEIRMQLDNQRPDGLFSDTGWQQFREQIISKFFMRFLSAEFFGRRNVNGVNVLGGLELNAYAGSYSDNLSLLDTGDSCPGIQLGAGFAGFTGFFALSRFRSVIRSDARCSGWHDKYLKHRKELVALSSKNPKLAALVVETAFLVSPVLASPKARLESRAVRATLGVVETLERQARPELQRDLRLFADVVKRGEGATLNDLITIAAKVVPPSKKTKSETSLSDARRTGPVA